MSDAYVSGFLARVTSWLGNQGIDGSATRVATDFSEWAGSTEEGFHDELSIEVHYTDREGKAHTHRLGAAEQESLWRAVVYDPTTSGA